MKNFVEAALLLVFQEPTKSVLDKEFVIKVNTRDDDAIDDLINLIKKYVSTKNNVIRDICYGDYLVFTKNDVRLETNDDKVADLDINIYKVNGNYSKIEKLIKNFFNNVYHSKKSSDKCEYCPFRTKRNNSNIIRDGQYVRMSERVNIGWNYVKVGYETYDIYNNRKGNFVNIEGEKFEVLVDYNGQYLKLVK